MPMSDVWVIDDDRSIRWVLHKALEREGFSVTTFEDATGALAQLSRARPDAIMSDIRMPGGDGLELLAGITARHPGLPTQSGRRQCCWRARIHRLQFQRWCQ